MGEGDSSKTGLLQKFCGSKKPTKVTDDFILQDFNIHSSIDHLRELGKDENLIYKALDILCYAVIVLPAVDIDALEKGKCALHSLLDVFLDLKFTDERDGDLIELLMIRSEINYEEYQEGIVLELLQRYNRVKYYQWLILNYKEHICIDDMNATGFTEDTFTRLAHNLRDLLQVTFAVGALKMLKLLMDFISQKYGPKYPILAIAVSCNVLVKEGCKKKYYKCFDYLLDRADVDVNAVDKSGETAFFIASHIDDDYMINELLKKKPYLAALNKHKDYAVNDLPLETLMTVLDSCVSSRPDHIIKNESAFKLLKSYQLKVVDLDNLIFMDLANFFPPDEQESSQRSFRVTEFIHAIANSNHLTQALTHPVVGALLETKWVQLRRWVLFRKQTFLLPILVGFILIKIFANPQHLALVSIFILVSLVLEICVIAASFRAKYFSYVSSLISVSLLILMIVFFASGVCNETMERHRGDRNESFVTIDPELEKKLNKGCLAVTTPMWILMGISVNYFIAFFNQTVAHYTIMLIYVAYSMIKFLISNIFLAIGFAVAYITLFNPEELDNDSNKKLAAFRTFAMLAGYIDGVERSNYRGIWTYILHAFLIFMIAIVALNLINGLAVGDVNYIQTQAQFWHRRVQCIMLYEVEVILKRLDEFLYRMSSKSKLSQHIITEHRFIAIRTTTGEVVTCDKVNNHQTIAALSENSVNQAVVIANRRELELKRNPTDTEKEVLQSAIHILNELVKK